MAIQRSYGGRMASWGKTYKAFSEALLSCGRQINERGKQYLIKDAETWLRDTDAEWPRSTTATSKNGRTMKFGGDAMHPWYLGHLHDSIAIRLAEGNKTIAIRFMPPASSDTEGQHMDHPKITGIIGSEWARDVAGRAEHTYWKGSKALQAQLIIGVPYAEKVNEEGRHAGYAEELESQFYDVMSYKLSTNLSRLMVKPLK